MSDVTPFKSLTNPLVRYAFNLTSLLWNITVSGSWFRASAMTTMNKKPTRNTVVLKSLKLYCILIPLYMFRALLRPSSGASQFCTYSLQSPCDVGLVVSSSFVLLLLFVGSIYLYIDVVWFYAFFSKRFIKPDGCCCLVQTHGDWRLYVQNWEAPNDGCKSDRNM
jgi:hypothetical protein